MAGMMPDFVVANTMPEFVAPAEHPIQYGAVVAVVVYRKFAFVLADNF